ncbi:MAG: chemotaxis protein CheB [Bacteroidetes bacterium]|nr:chemotaxis protein CheB [Bacteroidota bacterium]
MKSAKPKVIVIGGSAGSFQVVSQILSQLKHPFPIPVFLCLHRLKSVNSGFDEALGLNTSHTIIEPHDKQMIKGNRIYLAPANYHMLAEIGNTITLSVDEIYRYSRPSIDITFDSFSYVYGNRMIGIILSGANSDGAAGLYKAFQRGSYTVVQDRAEAVAKTMIDSTLKLFTPHMVAGTEEIIRMLNDL